MEAFDFKCPDSNTSVKIVLDGSHNDDSVHKFLQFLRAADKDEEVWVLFGTGKDKNAASMLQIVAHGSDKVIPVRAKHYRAAGIDELSALMPEEHRGKWSDMGGDAASIQERLLTAATMAAEQ